MAERNAGTDAPADAARGTDADLAALQAERAAHIYARERGRSRVVYSISLWSVAVLLRLWFRVQIFGRENIPSSGPAIIAPNHKNFFDVFFVGMATRRPVRYMAKTELFQGPLLGWLFPRVGAFPVRRGGSDSEALQTALTILADGGLVVMFPEGTRVEAPDTLGSPHHGAGRLALQAGVPIIPAAITGTSRLWRGAIPKSKRVQLAFLAPIPSHASPDGHDPASQLIDELVWPAVQEEYGSLRANPGVIAAVLAAIGVGGGLLAKHQRTTRHKPEVRGAAAPRGDKRRGRRKRS